MGFSGEELDRIYTVRPDGTEADIITDGLFAVKGTEELNEPLLSLVCVDK